MIRKMTATLVCAAALTVSPSFDNGAGLAFANEAPEKKAEPVSFSLERGEVLQIAVADLRDGAQQSRLDYYAKVFPLAEAEGYRRLAQLNVIESAVSEAEPASFSFFAWPNEEAERRFSSNPDWAEYKSWRPKGWDELAIYSVTIEKDLSLTFSPDKFYTVVVAWPDPETGADYTRYLDGIEPAVTRAGGRFIAKFYNPRFEAHASTAGAPGQLTFVEWESRDGFQKVQKMPEYLAHRDFFASGLDRFEFHWMKLAK